MAITNTTLEQINYIKDLDYSYNIKLILITFMLIFALIMLWYSKNRINRANERGDFTYYILNIFGWSIISFSPMYIFILLRTVDLYILMNWLFIIYGIALSILTLYTIYWLGEKFLTKYFNVNFNDRKKRFRDNKDYRRYD